MPRQFGRRESSKMMTAVETAQHNERTNNGERHLDKIGSNFEQEEQKSLKLKQFQRIRQLQNVTRKLSSSKTIRCCNSFPVKLVSTVWVDANGGNSNTTGMNTCRNKLFCPRCSYWSAMENAKLVHAVEQHVIDQDGSGLFFTLTVPHHTRSDLRTLNRQLSKCWTKLMNRSRFHKKLIEHHGSKDLLWARGFDYTLGKNGHHPHYHVLLYLFKKLSLQEFTELKFLFLTCWNKAVEQVFNKQSSPEGLDFQQIKERGKCVSYFNKVSMEISSSHSKEGFGESIWRMMSAYAETDDEDLKKVYKKKIKQFEEGTRKLRSMTFSGGFKALAEKLIEEQHDEEEIVEPSQRRIKFVDIRKDLMKLILKRRDMIRIHQLIDCYTCGDRKADAAIISFMRLNEKYSLEKMTENYRFDELPMDEMERDYNGFVYQMHLWEQYRDFPELFSKLFRDELKIPSN